MLTKQVREARDAVVSAAGDTQRAVMVVGVLAALALAAALVALALATRARA